MTPLAKECYSHLNTGGITMSKKERKKFLDIDVLEAAKQRINHIIDLFDTIIVCFSGGKVPVVMMEMSEPERMMLTIRINRAKGSHVALKMSDIVHKLVNEYGIPIEQLCDGIGARKAEIELLLMDNVFQAKGINESTKYSKAWIPNK